MLECSKDPKDLKICKIFYFLVRFVFGHALIAQSVEHAAVNRGVTGSSPV